MNTQILIDEYVKLFNLGCKLRISSLKDFAQYCLVLIDDDIDFSETDNTKIRKTIQKETRQRKVHNIQIVNLLDGLDAILEQFYQETENILYKKIQELTNLYAKDPVSFLSQKSVLMSTVAQKQ